ncbi:MAG: phosphotransferase family protein [Candidatus Levyibacteriota bacterium]
MSGIDTPESHAIAGWLAREMRATRVRIDRYERLSGGAIQGNFGLDIDVSGGPHAGHHALVLRTDAASVVAASSSRAQEFAVLRVAHAAGVLAPEPLFLCEDRSIIGREFFVMRRIPGIGAGHRLVREPALVPDGPALARELGANLARIHAIRPPQPALGALAAPPADPARTVVAQCRAHLDAMSDAHPTLEWGLRWCDIHAPAPSEVTLVHRDYRTGNYLVDGGHLTGVLDWEFAGWGDPREDLGWLTARCWRFGAVEREAGGIAPLEPLLEGYAAIARRTITRADLDYWQVIAHLRWAVIALQQARRHLSGGEASLELALTGRIVHELEYEVMHLTGARSR